LSSPGNQMQADAVRGMPVLVSYACAARWLDDYMPSFKRILIDSGAYSVLNSGKKIDLDAYADWSQEHHWADAVAALDDIAGDWQKGLENWRRYPWQFPTYHSSDPPEALDVILEAKPRWVGLGMVPPRDKKHWLLETLERLEGVKVHVHGWALGAYAWHPRLDSVDSTNWFMDSWKVRNAYPWLTPAEALEVVVKRYERVPRMKREPAGSQMGVLFEA
jgi:hypothetical protein